MIVFLGNGTVDLIVRTVFVSVPTTLEPPGAALILQFSDYSFAASAVISKLSS
jgi:hypothetical protein